MHNSPAAISHPTPYIVSGVNFVQSRHITAALDSSQRSVVVFNVSLFDDIEAVDATAVIDHLTQHRIDVIIIVIIDIDEQCNSNNLSCHDALLVLVDEVQYTTTGPHRQLLVAGNAVTILVHQLLDVAALADNHLHPTVAPRFGGAAESVARLVVANATTKHRKNHGSKNADDRHDDHQFDQGKTLLNPPAR